MPIPEEKLCKRCNVVKNNKDFYRRRDGSDISSYCRICSNNQTIERQRAFKKKCIEYKGGKCEHCGYNKYDGALDFHHKDPEQKDFSLAHVRLTSFSDKIKFELDKCLLLCSNCHREEHAKIDKTLPP